MNYSCAIILPTHSNYIGVCNNFIQLLRKNWVDCHYKVYVSYTGKETKFQNECEIIYNGEEASLTECVANAARSVQADYYLCFLGDAFINGKVDGKWVEDVLAIMNQSAIEYCSLMYVKNYAKRKGLNKQFRYIHHRDRYSHNFVAFIANKPFIDEVVSRCGTDLEFEKMFLDDAIDKYYNNHIIVNNNYLHIMPAITKGKWNRFAYQKLKKDNPEIDFEKRPIESFGESFYQWAHDKIIWLFPDSLRVFLKGILKKFLKKEFMTDK